MDGSSLIATAAPASLASSGTVNVSLRKGALAR